MVDRPKQEEKTEQEHDPAAENQRSSERGRIIDQPGNTEIAWSGRHAIGHQDDRDVFWHIHGELKLVWLGVVSEPQVRASRIRHFALVTGDHRGDQFLRLRVITHGVVARRADPRDYIARAPVGGEDRIGATRHHRLAAVEGVKRSAVNDGHGGVGRGRDSSRDVVRASEHKALQQPKADHESGESDADNCEYKSHGLTPFVLPRQTKVGMFPSGRAGNVLNGCSRDGNSKDVQE